MIQDLDAALGTLLDDPGAPADLRAADVTFATPDKNFTPGQPTVDLFLYEVTENRELRDPVPVTALAGAAFVRRTPPLRLDCTYLVTTWSNQTGAARIVEEHRLLGQAIAWLSRFPTLSPALFAGGSLADPPFPPPTMVAQMDPNKNAGEFWNALGIPPRPAFSLTVTIALDLAREAPVGPPVVTKQLDIGPLPPGAFETLFQIGGTIRSTGTLAPVAGATVTLVGTEQSAQSDADGRFTFAGLAAAGYTLHAEAAGFASADKPIAVPAAALNAYDMSLIP
jgi:hypothetical protein